MNKVRNPDREYPILNECLAATKELLCKYWNDIAACRDAQDQLVAVTLSFKVDCTEESPHVKTKLGFSRRYRDSREATVDMAQTVFPFIEADKVA